MHVPGEAALINGSTTTRTWDKGSSQWQISQRRVGVFAAIRGDSRSEYSGDQDHCFARPNYAGA